MDKKEEFKNYMYAGHGRAVKLLENNKDDFRKIVLYGCLTDISFDMQCEGSRGGYMYSLAMQYEDYDFFLKPVIGKFLNEDINTDWHTFCHLCDFIRVFADQNRDENARGALMKKYEDLYSLIMSSRYSAKQKEIIQSFEYAAIVLMQQLNFKFTLKIFTDIGAYFIRRRRTPGEDLKWLFEWFYHEAEEKYGSEFLKEELESHGKDSKEIKRFYLVMNTPDKKYEQKERPEPTAENVLKRIEDNSLKFAFSYHFRKNAEQSEKIKLAEMILAENDSDKKAEMLSIFSSKNCPFPLDPNELIEYAKSDNQKLRDTAVGALSCIRADCVHDFAVEMIDKINSDNVLDMLIYNCRDDDREIIFDSLNDMADKAYSSDFDSACELHGVVQKILDTSEEYDGQSEFINELVMFAYGKSPCSCCREWAFDELEKRNLLTEEILLECLYDTNSDLREKAENKLEQTTK